MNSIHLEEIEIIKLTGYKKPTFQLKFLKKLGVPAIRRGNNTICVLRRDCTNLIAANDKVISEPVLKSARK